MSVRHASRSIAIVVAFAAAAASVLQAVWIPGAAPAATTGPATDPGWPRMYTTPSEGRVVVYEPQMASWVDHKRMVSYAAVSYRAKGVAATAKPALGTIKLEAETRVAIDARLVNFANLRITESNFPTLTKEQLREVVAEITKAIPENDRVIALDRVLAYVDKSTIVPKNVPGLKADPPTIFFSQTPAILVNFDGDPVWSPIEKNDLKFAVNTNWDVFEHGASKSYYLRYNQAWLKATELQGPWTAAGKLPDSFASLPASDDFKEVRASVPGKPPVGQPPTVFVSFAPAELILLNGAPRYEIVQGTNLLWVANTESDVFRLGKSGPLYYLVAGRWFSAPDVKGPWTFATPSLPADFTRIPLEHARSRVLASVPGTEQAAEAVLLAQVPQTARVDKTQLQPEPVTYQGAPEFKSIQGTSLQRAINTDKEIILAGSTYYYCYQGVWFVGRAANGPWQVATTVPPAIYTIPASSPAHHVTYVVIEQDDDEDDAWVTFAYAPGYTGLMIGWGCAVWGSGWYYPPYLHHGGLYPVYYPHFPTYGYSAWYNPWSGTYGRSAIAYGPYGGMGATARYNPRTGTYARGAAAWGPYGAGGAAQAWNPRTGAYGHTRQGANIYGSWGSSSVHRGDDWLQTGRVTSRVTGTTTRVTRGDEGAAISRRTPGQGGGFLGANESGDIYAGRDGSVYRRQDGSWQKYENGGWGSVQRATPTGDASSRAAGAPAKAGTRQVDPATFGQLERDRGARAAGAQRARDYISVRSGGARAAGSYRAAGARRR